MTRTPGIPPSTKMRAPTSGVLLEAEAFDNIGGWTVDSQFDLEIGSPYLLAHGHGKPVEDATTKARISEAGDYNIWVRTKDWVPGHHPGRFKLYVNEVALAHEFGANDKDWNWEFGGRVDLCAGDISFRLQDLTGFGGRCDAIFLGCDNISPPNDVNEYTRSWRRQFRGLPDIPVNAGSFDVVVVGGGVPGAAATLTCARLGLRVALIHGRPYLGGNASVEIGLRPRGLTGPIVDEVYHRRSNNDISATKLLDAEPNSTIFLDFTAFNVTRDGSIIVSIDSRHARSGKEIRIFAPVYIDCSGKAILGLFSGAETMYGRESRAEYKESLAPLHADNMHHGNTVFFRTKLADQPSSFPPVPWAMDVARDYCDLGGQLEKPGVENMEGPKVERTSKSELDKIPRRMKIPATHFWEYGQWLDPYTQGEHIRDHLWRAIFGTFSNVKNMEPSKWANLELEHVAFVAAQGEFRRYKGDYILTENDIRSHTEFSDAVVQNDGAFCLHYPGHEQYDFRLKWWEWDERDGKPYDIPFRALYSSNISNLMFAGKHMSATHVASSNTKFMGNGGQHAIATAAAAHLCKKYSTTPRYLFYNHMEELKDVVDEFVRVHSRKGGRAQKL